MVARGSHSFTCHPHTNHTCLYSSAAEHHRPLAGTHCAYPRRDGQAELTWVAGYILRQISGTGELNPGPVAHPSINRAGRRVTLLIDSNVLVLPLRQTACTHLLMLAKPTVCQSICPFHVTISKSQRFATCKKHKCKQKYKLISFITPVTYVKCFSWILLSTPGTGCHLLQIFSSLTTVVLSNV